MPEPLRRAVTSARTQMVTAAEAAVEWLRAHPRASARELDVLALVTQGLSNAEIGGRLRLSEDQVKDTLRTVSRRWGCRGRAHLIATAFRLGYLQVTTGKPVKT